MKKFILIIIVNLSCFVTSAQSERIHYSTDSLKVACFEKQDTDISDYADGVCFGYIRAKIETLFIEKRFCQNLFNRENSIDDYVDIIKANLRLLSTKEVPLIFIHDTLSKQFC